MKLNFKSFSVVAAGLLGGMLFSQPAQALSIRLTSGVGDTGVIADNSGGDTQPLIGQLNWSGSVGAWSVNTESATTKPIFGSAGEPVLDLTSVNATASAGAADLHI